MQILTFVTMLLLLMSIATATRFNLFLLSSGLRHAYTLYIHQNFFDTYNGAQMSFYENAATPNRTKGGGGGKNTPNQNNGAGSSLTRINIHPFFAKTSDAVEYAENMRTLLVRFIEINYSKQFPFKDYFSKVSVEDFVKEMIETGKTIPVCGQTVQGKEGFSSIPFYSKEARTRFYWMLNGGGIEKRYPSILSYIEWKPFKAAINMYTVSEALLRAIYRNDQNQINQFLSSRQEISERIEDMDAALRKEKAKTWGALYNMEILTGFPPSFLDFSLPSPEPSE